MARNPVWVLAVPVVVLVACGGDPVPPGIPGTSVPDALPGTPAELEDALLTTHELGEGWVDLGAVPLDERGFEGCPETRMVTGGDDPGRLGEAQSLYGRGDPPIVAFAESISLWESPEVAAERLAASGRRPRSAGPSNTRCSTRRRMSGAQRPSGSDRGGRARSPSGGRRPSGVAGDCCSGQGFVRASPHTNVTSRSRQTGVGHEAWARCSPTVRPAAGHLRKSSPAGGLLTVGDSR